MHETKIPQGNLIRKNDVPKIEPMMSNINLYSYQEYTIVPHNYDGVWEIGNETILPQ